MIGKAITIPEVEIVTNFQFFMTIFLSCKKITSPKITRSMSGVLVPDKIIEKKDTNIPKVFNTFNFLFFRKYKQIKKVITAA